MKIELLKASKHKSELEYIQSQRDLRSAKLEHDAQSIRFRDKQKSFWSELRRPARKTDPSKAPQANRGYEDQLKRLYGLQTEMKAASQPLKISEMRLRKQEKGVVAKKIRLEAVEKQLTQTILKKKRKQAEVLSEEVENFQVTSLCVERQPMIREELSPFTAHAKQVLPEVIPPQGLNIQGGCVPKNQNAGRIVTSEQYQVASIDSGRTKAITVTSSKPGLQGVSVTVSKVSSSDVSLKLTGPGFDSTSRGLTEPLVARLRASFPHLKISFQEGRAEDFGGFPSNARAYKSRKHGDEELYDES